MTTAYSLTDTAPKDAGGQKFLALIDAHSSQGDFALWKGLGTSSPGTPARKVAHAAIGTHTRGSTIESNHPLVAIGGVYIENAGASPGASATTSGSAQIAGMTNWNELFTRSAPVGASKVSTSANTIKNGSGIIYGMLVSVSEVQLGAVVRLRDSLIDKLTFVAASQFGTYNVTVPDGGIVFSTTIQHAQTVSAGAASTTVFYR